eukprot:Awhi_evm1s5341
MSDQRLQRLQQQNERLKAELELPRIPASEASKDIIQFTKTNFNKDPLVSPGKDKNNPYEKKGGPCSLI